MVIQNYAPNHFENKKFQTYMDHLFKQKFLLYPCVINKVPTNFKELKSSYQATKQSIKR